MRAPLAFIRCSQPPNEGVSQAAPECVLPATNTWANVSSLFFGNSSVETNSERSHLTCPPASDRNRISYLFEVSLIAIEHAHSSASAMAPIPSRSHDSVSTKAIRCVVDDALIC